MSLWPNALDKLIVMIAKGEAASAPHYLATMLPNGTDLMPIRGQIERECDPEFAALIFARCPWLADDEFSRPAREKTRSPMTHNRRDPLDRLEEAQSAGLPASEFLRSDLDSLGDQVVGFDQPTGGRPRKMVRLANYDPRTNPFA